jgi:hypothetical protein
MKKIVPYLKSGLPKTCWGCGQPFVVREGCAEAILAPDGRLYCFGTDCPNDAFASQLTALRRVA